MKKIERIIKKVSNEGYAVEKLNYHEINEISSKGYMCIAVSNTKYKIKKI